MDSFCLSTWFFAFQLGGEGDSCLAIVTYVVYIPYRQAMGDCSQNILSLKTFLCFRWGLLAFCVFVRSILI